MSHDSFFSLSLQGLCSKGNSCTFAHGEEEIGAWDPGFTAFLCSSCTAARELPDRVDSVLVSVNKQACN